MWFVMHKAEAVLNGRQVVIRAEEGDVKAAFDEVVGALGEVLWEPAFRRPRGTDVESDDFITSLKVLIPEAVHIGLNVIGDKNFETRVEKVMEARLVENVKMGIDLVHFIFKVRDNRIKEQRETGFGIADNTVGTGSGGESGGTFVAIKINANVEVLLSNRAGDVKKVFQRVLIVEEEMVNVGVELH